MSATAEARLALPAGIRGASLPRVSGPAWGVVGVTVAFIALTCWWLSQDRSVPVWDAGDHLESAIRFNAMIGSGDLLGPFNHVSQYPPLALLVGALAMVIGGVNLATPIVAENLVFVSLLTLGCYQTGRILFGPRAGLLAAIFVLGSPLLIAQLHVFMLDAPETAMVAVSLWLLLASEDFKRTGVAAWAGLAVGCGLLVKVQFPFFLAGVVLAALARGGWRQWRGLAAFAAIALVVGAPWYVDHLAELHEIAQLGGTESGAVAGNLPATWSMANFSWYFWSTLNSQLFAPLFLLLLGGVLWTVAAVVRRRTFAGLRLELLAGLLVAWLAVTFTPHHDIRYDMPLMPYLAVLGAGWIVELPRVARLAATALLVAAVAANTLGTTFGVGRLVQVELVGSPPQTEAFPDRVVLYSNAGFLVAGPRRDGDIPGLLAAMHRDGVRVLTFNGSETAGPELSFEGLGPLALIAGMEPSFETRLVNSNALAVQLVHRAVTPGTPPTCTRMGDGTGLWVLRRNPQTGIVGHYCPFHAARYYS